MSASPSLTPPGVIASLHLHPVTPGAPLQSVETMEVIAGKGISGEPRYFGRVDRTGQPGRRQVSLMEREQIAEHAAALGLPAIAAGAVRANIETIGIDLVALIGRRIRIGDAILLVCEARKPCEKMDALCPGLRELMDHNRQGVLAQVVHPGRLRIGDAIRPV